VNYDGSKKEGQEKRQKEEINSEYRILILFFSMETQGLPISLSIPIVKGLNNCAANLIQVFLNV
jgi:hypothetical protein